MLLFFFNLISSSVNLYCFKFSSISFSEVSLFLINVSASINEDFFIHSCFSLSEAFTSGRVSSCLKSITACFLNTS